MRACLAHPNTDLLAELNPILENLRQRYRPGAEEPGRFGMMWTGCSSPCSLRNIMPTAPFVTLVLEGEKQVGQEGLIENCGPGALLLSPAQTPLGISNMPDAQGRYLALSVEFSQGMVRNVLSRIHAETPEKPFVPNYHAQAENTFCQPLPAWRAIYTSLLQTLDMALMPGATVSLVQAHGENFLHLLLCLGWHHLLEGQDSLPVRVRLLVRENLGRPWEMEEVAEALHMSARSLRRNLEACGTGLRGLLRQERLHAGLAMLQQGKHSVEEVAYACGYQSPSRFSRRFGEVFGISPGQVRLAGQPGRRGARLAV